MKEYKVFISAQNRSSGSTSASKITVKANSSIEAQIKGLKVCKTAFPESSFTNHEAIVLDE